MGDGCEERMFKNGHRLWPPMWPDQPERCKRITNPALRRFSSFKKVGTSNDYLITLLIPTSGQNFLQKAAATPLALGTTIPPVLRPNLIYDCHKPEQRNKIFCAYSTKSIPLHSHKLKASGVMV